MKHVWLITIYYHNKSKFIIQQHDFVTEPMSRPAAKAFIKRKVHYRKMYSVSMKPQVIPVVDVAPEVVAPVTETAPAANVNPSDEQGL